MDKFTSMLNKLGLRGSSDDDLRRSAQSTPRLSRNHRVRDNCRDSQRSYGSVGSVENYRVRVNQDWTRELELYNQTQHAQQQQVQHHEQQQHRSKKSKSHSAERIPQLGLDRTWDVERARGMELLYQSVERQKERQRQRGAGTSADAGHSAMPVTAPKDAAPGARGRMKKKKKDRHKSASRSRSHSHDKMELYMVDPPFRSGAMMDPNFTLSQERLERRIDELNKQLLAEKHSSHRDKLTLARLQQEMARQKSERQLRETLVRELERERMLRVAAEQRLREAVKENDTGKSRLKSMQDECQKMDEMAQSVTQFKGKLATLKQEKTSLAITYENNMQKFRTHVSNLEHENQILLAEIRNMESQCGSCHLCNKDISYKMMTNLSQAEIEVDKMKVLLERLKMLEAEKSSLVLENENQRQQYDKCLDEIANQVVQALMSQKTLREECTKLQTRVADLEAQNQQLNQMFQQQMKLASASVLQSLATKRVPNPVTMTTTTTTTSIDNCNPHAHTQVTYVGDHLGRPVAPPSGESSNYIGAFSEVSMESLQSLCSDYNEQLHLEDSLGKAQLSSPPPWLKDQVFQAGESPTSSIASPSTLMQTSQGPGSTESSHSGRPCGTSSSSSDRSDQSNNRNGKVLPVHAEVQDSKMDLVNSNASLVTGHVTGHVMTAGEITDKFTGDSSKNGVSYVGLNDKRFTEFPALIANSKPEYICQEKDKKQQIENLSCTSIDLAEPAIANKRNDILRALDALTSKIQGNGYDGISNDSSQNAILDHHIDSTIDSPMDRISARDLDELKGIPTDIFDDSDSDDCSNPRTFRNDLSGASTMSLNELLDQRGADSETPTDENWSLDDFHLGNFGDEKRLESAGAAPNLTDLIEAGKAVLEDPPPSYTSCTSEQGATGGHQGNIRPKEELSGLSCKPPLPKNTNQRPSAQDLSLPTRCQDVLGPRRSSGATLSNCLEYSSESDSDSRPTSGHFIENNEDLPLSGAAPDQVLCGNGIPQGHRSPTKSESTAFIRKLRQLAKEQSQDEDVKLVLANGGTGAPRGYRNDSGDYVMLKSPVKLDRSPNSGAGISRECQSQSGDNKLGAISTTTHTQSHSSTTQAHQGKVKCRGPDQTSPEKNIIYQNALRRPNVTSSPDSAMQHSFSSSSSSSEIVLGDKPLFRDDGYASNSGASSRLNANVSLTPNGNHGPPKVGKLAEFSVTDSGSRDKASVWTRDGICENMKASLVRRGLVDSRSNSSTDSKISGIVTEKKAMFEAQKGHDRSSRSAGRERRFSMPCTTQEEGDYVFLDIDRAESNQTQSTSRDSGADSSQTVNRAVSPYNTSLPKMGIPAKTRHLTSKQNRRHLSHPTLPTDQDVWAVSQPKLKKTTSDSCLVRSNHHDNNEPVVTVAPKTRPVQPPPMETTVPIPVKGSKKQRSKSTSTLKERSRSSSLSALRHHKVSSPSPGKDKNQCIVGCVVVETIVPQLEVKIPGTDPGFLREGCDVRGDGEGSENGYKSGDDHSSKKPSDSVLSTELYDSAPHVDDSIFDVRKYRQLLQAESQGSQPSQHGTQGSSSHTSGKSFPDVEDPLTPTELSVPCKTGLETTNLMKSTEFPASGKQSDLRGISTRELIREQSNSNFVSTRNKPELDIQYTNFWSNPLATSTHGPDPTESDISSRVSYQTKSNIQYGAPHRAHNVPHGVSYRDDAHLSVPYGNDAHSSVPYSSDAHLSVPYGNDAQSSVPYQNVVTDVHRPASLVGSPVSPPTGNFHDLMENLAKKSEHVLKSKIFHREHDDDSNKNSVLDYDSILNINFENDPTPLKVMSCGARQQNQRTRTTDPPVHQQLELDQVTSHIEHLTKTVDSFQVDLSRMSVDDLVESCRPTQDFSSSHPAPRPGPLRVTPLGNHGYQKQWRTTVPPGGQSDKRGGLRYTQQVPFLYRDGFEASNSSSEDAPGFGYPNDPSLRKVRRRRKKTKPHSQNP